jgi:hypothetical protein
MLKSKGRARPVANTEAGFRSYQSSAGLFYNQARLLVQKITVSRAAGLEFYVWFMLQDYWDKYINADDSFGLVNRGQPAQAVVCRLSRTDPAVGEHGSRRECRELDGRLESYRFSDDSDDVYVRLAEQDNASFSFCPPEFRSGAADRYFRQCRDACLRPTESFS